MLLCTFEGYSVINMRKNLAGKEFLSSIVDGKEEAFEVLFNEYNTPLTSYAFRILNDMNDAREVVHITFCKLWDNHRKLVINDSLKAYLAV